MKIQRKNVIKIDLEDDKGTEITIDPEGFKKSVEKWWNKGLNVLETIKDKLNGDD